MKITSHPDRRLPPSLPRNLNATDWFHRAKLIRPRSEPVNVDLGCGFRKNGNVGIDVTTHGTEADIICRIGFQSIPLDDEVADTVYCRDFLEHLPNG